MSEPRPSEYLKQQIREELASDGELGLDIEIDGDVIHVRGTVPTEERKTEIGNVVLELCPDHDVRIEIEIGELHDPQGAEDIS